jgi:hypothetical protein
VSYKRPIKHIADGSIDVQEPPLATEAAAAPAAPDAAPDAPATPAAAADPPAEAAVSPVKETPTKAGRGAKHK